jgi:NAD(P)-dependent dehydrogenase (short-subunit alcohol dehydrogenase family)
VKLQGKVALVTGGSRGIGKAVVTRLAAEGATVALDYRQSSAQADTLVAELGGRGFKVQAFQADVSKPANCQALVTEVLKSFGQLDILVSNAGVDSFAKLEDITEEEYHRVFSINVGGQLFITQAAARHLPAGGRIVLTSSISAKSAVLHHTLYSASKAAVSAMALNLAKELGERGITINAIAPGGTETDMATENRNSYIPPTWHDLSPDILETIIKSQLPLGRLAKPEEVAAVVAFLVSEDAAFITGSTVAVDGGGL